MKTAKDPHLAALKALLGSQRRVADVLGVSEEHVSRMINGHTDVPRYVALLAHCLQTLPVKDWPKEIKP